MAEAVRGHTIQRIMTKKQQKQLLYWLRENEYDYTVNHPGVFANIVHIIPPERSTISGRYMDNIASIARALGLNYWIEATIQHGVYISMM